MRNTACFGLFRTAGATASTRFFLFLGLGGTTGTATGRGLFFFLGFSRATGAAASARTSHSE